MGKSSIPEISGLLSSRKIPTISSKKRKITVSDNDDEEIIDEDIEDYLEDNDDESWFIETTLYPGYAGAFHPNPAKQATPPDTVFVYCELPFKSHNIRYKVTDDGRNFVVSYQWRENLTPNAIFNGTTFHEYHPIRTMSEIVLDEITDEENKSRVGTITAHLPVKVCKDFEKIKCTMHEIEPGCHVYAIYGFIPIFEKKSKDDERGKALSVPTQPMEEKDSSKESH